MPLWALLTTIINNMITTVYCICYSVCVCIVQYFFAFIVHCCVVPLTSVPPTTYPPPSTQHMQGYATTVGWLLIMTTVGKTHAVKYTKEATLTKPIHY